MTFAPHDLLFDHYQIGYVVDNTAACTLYRAHDQRDMQAVLIAELPHPDEAALQQTTDILAVVGELQIVGLLPILESYIQDTTCYIVMSDYGGQDLGRLIRETTTNRTSSESGEFVEHQVAELVRFSNLFEQLHTHTPPLLVGDLQAADVWVTNDDRIYLAASALVRPYGGVQSVYRAPEIEPETAIPTPQSDMYALGAASYHWLTGWAPISAKRRQTGTPLTSLQLLNNTVDPFLEQVILRSLALLPTDRYQTARALQQALEAVTIVRRAAVAPLSVAAPVQAPVVEAAVPSSDTPKPVAEPEPVAAPVFTEESVAKVAPPVTRPSAPLVAASTEPAALVEATSPKGVAVAEPPEAGLSNTFIIVLVVMFLVIAIATITGAVMFFTLFS